MKSNDAEKREFSTETVNISIELVKEVFIDLFLKQEQNILDIVQNRTPDTNSRIGWLTQEIKNSNTRLDVLLKET